MIPALVSLSLKAEFPEAVRNSLRDKGVGSPNCTICELLDLRFLSDPKNKGAFFEVISSQCPLGRQALIRHARWFLKPRAILPSHTRHRERTTRIRLRDLLRMQHTCPAAQRREIEARERTPRPRRISQSTLVWTRTRLDCVGSSEIAGRPAPI